MERDTGDQGTHKRVDKDRTQRLQCDRQFDSLELLYRNTGNLLPLQYFRQSTVNLFFGAGTKRFPELLMHQLSGQIPQRFGLSLFVVPYKSFYTNCPS